MMADENIFDGGCTCGAIRYRLEAEESVREELDALKKRVAGSGKETAES